MSSTNAIIYYSYGPRLVQKISHWLICFLDWMISLFILICISFFIFAVGLFFWSSSGNAHVAIRSLWISISYNGHPRSQEQPASINQYSSWYCILTQSGNYIFICQRYWVGLKQTINWSQDTLVLTAWKYIRLYLCFHLCKFYVNSNQQFHFCRMHWHHCWHRVCGRLFWFHPRRQPVRRKLCQPLSTGSQ